MPHFLYQKLCEELRRRILSNNYPPGTYLPSEANLKREFNASQITVRRAIRELVLLGLVETMQGKGTYILPGRDETIIIGLSNFTSDVARGRLEIDRTLLSDALIPAPDKIAEKLGVNPGSTLRNLVRLDCLNGDPLSIDEVYLPLIHSDVIDTAVAASPLFMHLIQKAGKYTFSRTKYDIRVAKASEREQRHLKVEIDSPLLVTDELVYDTSGNPILFVSSAYPAYKCRLSGMVKLVQKKTEQGIIGE